MKKITIIFPDNQENEQLYLNPVNGKVYNKNQEEMTQDYDYYLGQYGEQNIKEGWID